MTKQTIVLTVEGQELTATLEDNASSRDFLNKLPLTISMDDLHRREKYINGFDLETDKSNIRHFSKGDLSYYLPMDALVIYYEGDQESLNGLVKLGEVTNGIEKLAEISGIVEITFEAKDKNGGIEHE